SIAGLRYVAAVCPSVEAVVKLDDDVAWNIHRTKLIVDYAIRNGHIYCAGYVSVEEYREKEYPPYCIGFAYVIPRLAFSAMLKTVSEQRYFWATTYAPEYNTIDKSQVDPRWYTNKESTISLDDKDL
ncbi:hypothetical protein OSTOST_19973, partial [Ostertagia ostertagi]